MSTRRAGRARQPANQAMHPPAPMNGDPASAKSRASNVATAPIALFIPLSDAVIYGHLAGEHTVGVYPLLEDDSCYFLAVDFDEAEWRDDARGFMQSCEALGVPAALEISRSGQGAHAWVFFAGRVSARDARRLGTAIISHTCARTRQLQAELLRPTVSQPGHDAQRWIRQPDCVAAAEGAARDGVQCVRRRRAAAVPGSVGVLGGYPTDGRSRHRGHHFAGHRWRTSA